MFQFSPPNHKILPHKSTENLLHTIPILRAAEKVAAVKGKFPKGGREFLQELMEQYSFHCYRQLLWQNYRKREIAMANVSDTSTKSLPV